MSIRMRNFEVEATIPGRKTPVRFGPNRMKDGFVMHVSMRDKNQLIPKLRVTAYVNNSDQLVLQVIDVNGKEFYTTVTERHTV